MPDEAVLEALLAGAGLRDELVPARDTSALRFALADEEPDREVLERERIPVMPTVEDADLVAKEDLPFAGGRSLETRMDAVVGWILGSTGAHAAFVADTEGLPLANRHAPENYVAATALLERADRLVAAFVPSPVAGSTTLELHGGNTLQIIWAESAAGRLAVGLVAAAGLDRKLCSTVRRMVQLAVDVEGVT